MWETVARDNKPAMAPGRTTRRKPHEEHHSGSMCTCTIDGHAKRPPRQGSAGRPTACRKRFTPSRATLTCSPAFLVRRRYAARARDSQHFPHMYISESTPIQPRSPRTVRRLVQCKTHLVHQLHCSGLHLSVCGVAFRGLLLHLHNGIFMGLYFLSNALQGSRHVAPKALLQCAAGRRSALGSAKALWPAQCPTPSVHEPGLVLSTTPQMRAV